MRATSPEVTPAGGRRRTAERSTSSVVWEEASSGFLPHQGQGGRCGSSPDGLRGWSLFKAKQPEQWELGNQSCNTIPEPPALMKLLAQHQELKEGTGFFYQAPAILLHLLSHERASERESDFLKLIQLESA